ncbi:MAG: hypothetical protein HKP41_21945 [Desulfobacterales bacterium]|nr:hypothetical protein [Deltaproteobacteria bacterium]NNK97026.1 hypothetical protein [Desulfobacterales bacterium]
MASLTRISDEHLVKLAAAEESRCIQTRTNFPEFNTMFTKDQQIQPLMQRR